MHFTDWSREDRVLWLFFGSLTVSDELSGFFQIDTGGRSFGLVQYLLCHTLRCMHFPLMAE